VGEPGPAIAPPGRPESMADDERLARLEQAVAALREELDQVKSELQALHLSRQ